MRLLVAVVSLLITVVPASAQTAGTAPTIDDLISLKRVGSPTMSPDGRFVAYTVRETNWDDNLYKTEIWLADAQSGETRQLTNSSSASRRSKICSAA